MMEKLTYSYSQWQIQKFSGGFIIWRIQIRGINLYNYNFGGTDFKKIEERASAEAVIAEGKKPLATRGSGKRRKLPSGAWGGVPKTDAILSISYQNWVHFVIL